MEALGQIYFLGICVFAIVFGLVMLATGLKVWKLPRRSQSRLGFLGYLGVVGFSLFKGVAHLWGSFTSSMSTSSIHMAIAITVIAPLLYLFFLDQWQRRAPATSLEGFTRETNILSSILRVYLTLGIIFVVAEWALLFYRHDLAAVFRLFPLIWSLPLSLPISLLFSGLTEILVPLIYLLCIFFNASLFALVFLSSRRSVPPR